MNDIKQATPRPWRIEDPEELPPYIVGPMGTAGRDGERVICDLVEDDDETLANAELIVAAVNAHEALQAALQSMVETAEMLDHYNDPAGQPDAYAVLAHARETLKAGVQ